MIGIVLAGGASRRFDGRAKGLIQLVGRPMALRAADMLAPFCTTVAIEAVPDAGYEALGLPLIHAPAKHAGKGPLAGLAAGLGRAGPNELIAFAPCDMPLLTRTIYDNLAEACGKASGAYAATAKGVEPLVAILNASMREALLQALEQETLPRTHAVLDAAGARAVTCADATPFENVNTPADLERLETTLRLKASRPGSSD